METQNQSQFVLNYYNKNDKNCIIFYSTFEELEKKVQEIKENKDYNPLYTYGNVQKYVYSVELISAENPDMDENFSGLSFKENYSLKEKIIEFFHERICSPLWKNNDKHKKALKYWFGIEHQPINEEEKDEYEADYFILRYTDKDDVYRTTTFHCFEQLMNKMASIKINDEYSTDDFVFLIKCVSLSNPKMNTEIEINHYYIRSSEVFKELFFDNLKQKTTENLEKFNYWLNKDENNSGIVSEENKNESTVLHLDFEAMYEKFINRLVTESAYHKIISYNEWYFAIKNLL